MFTSQKSKNKTSSRQQIDIKGVRDNILLLAGDRYRMVVRVSSVNFELKSEAEQDALIDIYGSFLNSLSCPLQILIRTREIDMDRYLSELDDRLADETETIYKMQFTNYEAFIRSLIANNKILTRHFYVVVPYDATHSLDFDTVKEQLNLQTDIVCKGLSRLGMQTYQLTSLEILDLFYSFYNPELAKCQPLTDQTLQFIRSMYIDKGISHE